MVSTVVPGPDGDSPAIGENVVADGGRRTPTVRIRELDDAELLTEFVRSKSEAAFTRLVNRHLHLVYSVALRLTANPHPAEEISQTVFITLARKARSLGGKPILSGWRYHTARLTTANFQRAERRRIGREQEADMQTNQETTTAVAGRELIPICFLVELNSLVFFIAGCVTRQSQIRLNMLLPRAWPSVKNPARLKLNLKAHWN